MSNPIAPTILTTDNFRQEVLESSLPVLVDFWAPWCGPCRVVAPLLEALAKEFAGQVKVAKLNVDEFEQLASQYQIQAIPTLLFFKAGQVVDQVTGVAPKATLITKLNALTQTSPISERAA